VKEGGGGGGGLYLCPLDLLVFIPVRNSLESRQLIGRVRSLTFFLLYNSVLVRWV
jgi:hypothetical protein